MLEERYPPEYFGGGAKRRVFGALRERAQMKSIVTISGAQRQVLYELILDRLSAVGDLNLLIKQGDYATVERLASEFAGDLRLMADLGWEKEWRDDVDLTMSAAELGPVLTRLREAAEGGLSESADEREARQAEDAARCRYTYARETCAGLLLLIERLEAGE